MLISLGFDMFAVVGLDGGDSNIEVDIDQSQFESSSVSPSDISNGNGRIGEHLRAWSCLVSGVQALSITIPN